jgi:hypothetical protein
LDFWNFKLGVTKPYFVKKYIYFNKDVPIIDCGYDIVFFQYQSDLSMKDPPLLARLV